MRTVESELFPNPDFDSIKAEARRRFLEQWDRASQTQAPADLIKLRNLGQLFGEFLGVEERMDDQRLWLKDNTLPGTRPALDKLYGSYWFQGFWYNPSITELPKTASELANWTPVIATDNSLPHSN